MGSTRRPVQFAVEAWRLVAVSLSPTSGYLGQYYDKETDTWYNLKRDYDAKTGRYLQSDPKGTIDGPNTYLYAGNNPVNRIDPSGEYFWVIVGAAVDIGLQAYQNGWDFGKVDYADVALNAANPARFIKWGTKGYKASQDARQVAAAGNQLSVSQGIVAQGGKKVGAASAIKEGSNAIKRGPPPNGGNAKPHGNTNHNTAIDNRVNELKNDQSVTNIRKNQQQVDVNGNKVGTNRPDIQYDKGSCHYCVEYDHIPKNSTRHGQQIRANDPKSKIELNLL